MRVTVTADATKLCPYANEMDEGTVEVTFEVHNSDAPEIHLLGAKLEAAYGQARSHEEFTRWVAQSVGAIRVVTRWRTAGMDILCDWQGPPTCKRCAKPVPPGDEGQMSGLCQQCLNGPWIDSAPIASDGPLECCASGSCEVCRR